MHLRSPDVQILLNMGFDPDVIEAAIKMQLMERGKYSSDKQIFR